MNSPPYLILLRGCQGFGALFIRSGLILAAGTLLKHIWASFSIWGSYQAFWASVSILWVILVFYDVWQLGGCGKDVVKGHRSIFRSHRILTSYPELHAEGHLSDLIRAFLGPVEAWIEVSMHKHWYVKASTFNLYDIVIFWANFVIFQYKYFWESVNTLLGFWHRRNNIKK